MKVSVTGGAPIALCDAPNGRGGTWGADGTIVFTPTNGANIGLLRVSSAGGKPEPLIPLEEGEVTQRWPQLLPGGGAVLYTSNTAVGAGVVANANIVVHRLPNGERKVLERDAVYGRYLPSGHLDLPPQRDALRRAVRRESAGSDRSGGAGRRWRVRQPRHGRRAVLRIRHGHVRVCAGG